MAEETNNNAPDVRRAAAKGAREALEKMHCTNSANPIPANESARHILSAMGIPMNHVKSIVMELNAGDITVLKVDFIVTRSDWNEITGGNGNG